MRFVYRKLHIIVAEGKLVPLMFRVTCVGTRAAVLRNFGTPRYIERVLSMGRLLLLLVVVVCSVIGYWILTGLFMKNAFTDSEPRDSNSSHSARRKAKPKAKEMERYYRDALGVSEEAGEQEIRAAYRSQLAKYHPDKVTHLGDEFYELASFRTREIIQAYTT